MRDDGGGLSGEVVFETERLRCRRWLPSDLDAIFEVYSDVEGARWVGDGLPITRSESERWLEVTARNYRKRGYGMFALEDINTSMILGFCGLVHPGDQLELEVKYAFRRSHWGLGLASEAVPALLAFGARSHGLTRVIATVAPENKASQRVLHKAGMVFVEVKDDEDDTPVEVFEWHANGGSL